MGCCCSTKLESKIQGQTLKDFNFLRTNLKLDDEDLRLVLKAFRKINLHNNGIVAFDELCARIKCEPSYFLESVFSFFSSSDNTCDKLTVGLNFAEFTLFCSFFLTLDDHGFTEYLFLILTDGEFNKCLKNKNDTFNIANFNENIHHSFGNAWGKNERKRSDVAWVFDNSHTKLGGDGVITKEEFFNGCEKNKSLLFPAKSIQIDMREKIVNKAFWKCFKGLGTQLLKRDIRAIRDALHRQQGRTQYHDNIDHYHRSQNQNNKLLASIPDSKETNDAQRHQRSATHTQAAESTAHASKTGNNIVTAGKKANTATATTTSHSGDHKHTKHTKLSTTDTDTEVHVAHFPPRRNKALDTDHIDVNFDGI